MHSAKSLVPTKKKSFNKYLSLPPRCGKWIEAQAAQYITTLATCQVLTSSEPDFCLTASHKLRYKQSMKNILKLSANRARQTPRRNNSKRRDKHSTRSCSPAAFSIKGEDKDKATSRTLRNHQKTHSPTIEQKVRPRPWKKRLDKAAATWK